MLENARDGHYAFLTAARLGVRRADWSVTLRCDWCISIRI